MTPKTTEPWVKAEVRMFFTSAEITIHERKPLTYLPFAFYNVPTKLGFIALLRLPKMDSISVRIS